MTELLGHLARPALDVAGVSHSYGTHIALDDVSLEVPQGRFVALLGVAGAGKSTLFDLVTRRIDGRVGAVSICGHPVRSEAGAALARTGVVFPDRSPDAGLTVAETFRYQGALHGMSWAEVRPRMAELLARIGLADRAGEAVGRLSDGQARRVGIVRALLHGPSLLLCDEATAGLDGHARAEIVADMHKLAEDHRIGVLWATGLADEIWPDDAVVVLHRGRVLARGPAREVAGRRTLSETFRAMTRTDAGDRA